MAKPKDFFSQQNTVRNVSEDKKGEIAGYLRSVQAFSRLTYKSVYVIDYQKKGFDFVSDNELFLCGYSQKEVKEMGYLFYFKCVIEEDIPLLLKINKVGFNFFEDIPVSDRLHYTISYDFHLINQQGAPFLINHQLTPMFLTKSGKIWKALCLVSLSNETSAGNIYITKANSNEYYRFYEKKGYWSKQQKAKLTEREKEIILHSSKGYTIDQIAEELFLSSETIKFHRKSLYQKLFVNNMSEAIVVAINRKLI